MKNQSVIKGVTPSQSPFNSSRNSSQIDFVQQNKSKSLKNPKSQDYVNNWNDSFSLSAQPQQYFHQLELKQLGSDNDINFDQEGDFRCRKSISSKSSTPKMNGSKKNKLQLVLDSSQQQVQKNMGFKNSSSEAAAWWPLIQLCVQLTILAHIVALFYYGVALLQIEWWGENNTWVQARGYFDQSWLDTYLHAVYWSFQTMVSNNLYEPTTRTDTLYSVISIMAMTGIFGYVLNTIGMILENLERKSKKSKLEREITNRFMKKRQIPQPTRERISLYLEYLHKQERERNKEEEEMVLDRLSDQLRNEIMYFINKKHVEMFPMIYKNFSQETLKQTMLIIKEETYSPGETIYKQSQKGDTIQDLSIFVVLKGSVEIFHIDNEGKHFAVEKIKQNGVFGNLEFFTGQPRVEGVKSQEASTIISIDRNKFLKILEKERLDYEKFLMIQDQMRMETYSIFNEFRCYLCHKQGHYSIKCPTTNLNINVKELIYDYNHFNLQINRVEFDRKQYRSHLSLIDMEEIRYGVEEIFENENELTVAVQKLQLELMQSSVGRRGSLRNQYINQNYFTNSSNQISDDVGLMSLAKIQEESIEQEAEQSMKNPFEFSRKSPRNGTQRRTSIISRIAQFSDLADQIQEDNIPAGSSPRLVPSQHNILMSNNNNNNNNNKRNAITQMGKLSPNLLSIKRNSIVSEEDQYMASSFHIADLSKSTQVAIKQRNKRVKSNIGGGGSRQFPSSSSLIKQQNNSSANNIKDMQQLQYNQIPLHPGLGNLSSQVAKHSFNPHEQEIQEQEQEEQKIYIYNNFDKMKNWTVYLPHNNFERIRFNEGVKKYFRSQDIIDTERNDSQRNSFFKRRGEEAVPSKTQKFSISRGPSSKLQDRSGLNGNFTRNASNSIHLQQQSVRSNRQRGSGKDSSRNSIEQIVSPSKRGNENNSTGVDQNIMFKNVEDLPLGQSRNMTQNNNPNNKEVVKKKSKFEGSSRKSMKKQEFQFDVDIQKEITESKREVIPLKKSSILSEQSNKAKKNAKNKLNLLNQNLQLKSDESEEFTSRYNKGESDVFFDSNQKQIIISNRKSTLKTQLNSPNKTQRKSTRKESQSNTNKFLEQRDNSDEEEKIYTFQNDNI